MCHVRSNGGTHDGTEQSSLPAYISHKAINIINKLDGMLQGISAAEK